MQLDITKQNEVPLLNRQRVTVMIHFDGGATPSNQELKDEISKKLKVNKDLLAVRHIYQRFGATSAKVIVHVYKTRDELLHLEKIKKGEKKQMEATKKAAEEAAKAKAAEGA